MSAPHSLPRIPALDLLQRFHRCLTDLGPVLNRPDQIVKEQRGRVSEWPSVDALLAELAADEPETPVRGGVESDDALQERLDLMLPEMMEAQRATDEWTEATRDGEFDLAAAKEDADNVLREFFGLAREVLEYAAVRGQDRKDIKLLLAHGRDDGLLVDDPSQDPIDVSFNSVIKRATWGLGAEKKVVAARVAVERLIRELYRDTSADESTPAPSAPSDGATAKRRRGRGRPLKTDLKADQWIYEAWKTGHYKTYRDLARELCRNGPSMTGHDAECAVQRHEKRIKRTRDKIPPE